LLFLKLLLQKHFFVAGCHTKEHYVIWNWHCMGQCWTGYYCMLQHIIFIDSLSAEYEYTAHIQETSEIALLCRTKLWLERGQDVVHRKWHLKQITEEHSMVQCKVAQNWQQLCKDTSTGDVFYYMSGRVVNFLVSSVAVKVQWMYEKVFITEHFFSVHMERMQLSTKF
jgi:hypothetical protein